MRWKVGLAVVAAGFVIAAASAARAENYVDAKAGFRVTIPKGWTRTTETNSLMVRAPDTDTTFGFCFVNKHSVPGTESVSQTEIDSRLAGKFTAAFWQKSFGDLNSVVIEDTGEEVQNGRKTHYAVLTYTKLNKAHRLKTVVHFLPARQYQLTCDAYAEAYARERPAFETFFDSFVQIDPAP